MTQEEIIEFNIKCHKFLGRKIIYNQGELKVSHYAINGIPYLDFMLPYHSDWNSIMEIIDAIEKLKYLIVIQSNFCQIQEIGSIENNFEPLIIASLYGDSKKEAVIQSIDKFFDWYETQNK